MMIMDRDLASVINTFDASLRDHCTDAFQHPSLPNAGELQGIEPTGWIPASIGAQFNTIRWLEIGSKPLSDGFFYLDIRTFRSQAVSECETDASVLAHVNRNRPSVAPAGFIFHMSRCGSTLLTRALRAIDGTLILAEAQPVSHLLHSYPARGEEQAVNLTHLFTLFAHYDGQPPKHVVVKPSLGGIACYPLVRKLWPHVPCVILIRNPLEVLVSNLSKPPLWLQEDRRYSGLHWFGMPPREVLVSNSIDYCCWILSQFCEHALQATSSSRIIDYEALNLHTIEEIATFFGLGWSQENRSDIQRLLTLDAKRPSQAFCRDGATKQQQATATMRSSVGKSLEPLYNELCRRSRG